ncbi:hypothetical protein [Hydrogenimonas sp.]
MKKWVPVLFLLLLFGGCGEKRETMEKLSFSLLIPQPVPGQTIHYAEGMQIFTSRSGDSVVSAMVINNPIPAGKEAVVAIAIENLGEDTIDLKWDDISFFNPKNYIKLLPVDQIDAYFKRPDRCKPMLNTDVFRPQMLRYGIIQEPSNDTEKRELFPTEVELSRIFKAIRKDLCYTRLPNNTTLAPHSVTVGYMVILLPEENFRHRMLFMLKIPIQNSIHKLRYALQPLE